MPQAGVIHDNVQTLPPAEVLHQRGAQGVVGVQHGAVIELPEALVELGAALAGFGDEAVDVDCLQYPCSIGDNYHDGKFWSVADDGTETEIEYVPTQEQQVADLQYLNNELTVAMADVLGGAV